MALFPQEAIEAIREAVIYLAHTRDGARVAMHCLWHGTPKVSGPGGLPSPAGSAPTCAGSVVFARLHLRPPGNGIF